MKKEKEEYIYFSSGNFFKKGDVIKSFKNDFLVIERPRNKWYHFLLHFIFKKCVITDKYRVKKIIKDGL